MLVTNENEECHLNCEEALSDSCNLDIPFTCKEIKVGIKRLKNGKSASLDLILNEFIKAGSNILITTLTKLFNKILNSGKISRSLEYILTDLHI